MKKERLSFAAKICLLYALIGGGWIVFSDRMLGALFVNPVQLTQIQTYKGWLFILASAALLFALLKAEGKSRRSAEAGLRETEARFRALIEQMPAAVYTDTPDEFSSNLYSSPQITAITGHTPEEWQSDPELWVKLIHPEDRQRVLEENRRAIKNREPFHMEYRMTARDGRLVWVHDMATLFCDDKGEPLYRQGLLLDITGQKEAVETLRTSEARYQTIVEHASDGIFITDQQWKFLDANLRACLLLGYSREELLGLSIRDLFTIEELASRPLRLQELLEGNTLVTERTLVRRDGTLLPVEFSARLLPDGRLLGIARDIRERKLTQEALARSEQRFRSLIENSMDAIALYTTDGKIIYQSPSSLQILGYTSAETAGHSVFEYVHPDDLMLARDKFQEVLQTPANSIVAELRCIHKDGSTRWVEIIGTNRVHEPGIEAIVANYRDITERKRAEVVQKALYQITYASISASSLDDLYRSIHQALACAIPAKNFYIALYDPETNLLSFPYYADEHNHLTNRGAAKGLTEYVLRNQSPLLASPDVFRHLIATGEVESFGAPSLDWLGVPLTAAGQTFGVMVVQTYEEGIRYGQHELDIMQFVSSQVALAIERRRVEESLAASEERYRQLVDLSPDAIAIHSEGKVRYINPAGLKIVGASDAREIIGKPILDFVHPDYREIAQQRAREGIEKREPQPPLEEKFLRLDGSTVDVEVTSIPRIHLGKPAAQVIIRDITERKRAQVTLKRQLEELTILHAIAVAESSSTNVDEVIERVTEIIGGQLYPENCGILLLNAKGNALIPHPSYRGTTKENLATSLPLNKGISGKVASSGKAIRIGNVAKDPAYYEVMAGVQAELCMPLVIGKQVFGVLNVESKELNAFTEEDERLLNTIAGGLAATIERLHLLQETKRRVQESTAIAEVGRDISSTLQLDMVLERIASYAKELLRAETSAVYLYEPRSSTLRAIAAIGLDAEELKNDPRKIGTGIIGHIAINKTGEIVNYAASDPRAVTVKGTKVVPSEHIMGVPVLTKDQLTGLLVVWRTGEGLEFALSELDFLTSLARQAAVAIENARLFQLEQKRRQEAETLQLAATAVTSSLEPKQVLETILIALQQVVLFDSAAMMLIENGHVRIVAARGFPDNEQLIGQVFPASNALLQAVNHSGHALVLEDAQEDPRFERWVDAVRVHGWMGVPLIARGKIIGYFTVDSYKRGAFDDNTAALAQTFAHQASAAIENARLYNVTCQRLEEQEIISRVSVALRSAENSEEMLTLLLDEIMASIGSNTCAIWLYDANQNELVRRIASGWLAKLRKTRFKPNEGMVGHVFATGKPHLSEEFAQDPMVHPDNLNVFGEGWGGITIPIQIGTNVIGVLAAALPVQRHFEPNHVRLLTTIAEIAGSAIQRVNLYQQSEEQVHHLTALREVDTAIASSFDLNVTLNILANHIVTQMGADAVSIFILEADQLTLTCMNAVGFSTKTISEMNLRVGEGVAGKAVLNRKDVYIRDLSLEKSFRRRNILSEDKFVSYYAVPMISKGMPQGVLEVFFRQTFTPTPDWARFIQALAGQATIAIDNARLFEDLQRSNQELSLAYDTTLEGWGKALELRDKETHGHTRRVTDLTLKLARQIGLPETDLVHIRRGVLLHDIGKMGVSDHILHKEGPLLPEERVEMENHPVYAHELLSSIPYLQPALVIPYCHHEWWDGSGYPHKLKGEQIPIAARLFAIVDVWDALLSDRPYRRAWTKGKAIQYLREHSGTQFDPSVLEVFLKMVQPRKRKK